MPKGGKRAGAGRPPSGEIKGKHFWIPGWMLMAFLAWRTELLNDKGGE